MLVWAPVILTVLLLAGAADASRGVTPDAHEGAKQLFYALGGALGFGGIVVGGLLATGVGVALFLLTTPGRRPTRG